MNIEAIQVQLFQHIKSKTNAASLADEIAAALNISTDSAYRRIRGEKPVTLEEVAILCARYQLSLDALLNLKTDAISFQGKFTDPISFRFEEYIASVLQQVNIWRPLRSVPCIIYVRTFPGFIITSIKNWRHLNIFSGIKPYCSRRSLFQKKFG